MNQVKDSEAARSRAWPGRAAWLGVVLMLVVVIASAWLRLSAPRAACGDWPACRTAAQRVPVWTAPAAAATAEAVMRGVHRVTASLALLVIVGLVVQAARGRAAGAGPLPGALLVLALTLSVLGIVTPGSRSAFVMLGNLLGGMVMFALAYALARRLALAPALSRPWRRVASLAAVTWLVQAALGALSGAPPPSGTPAPALHVVVAIVAAGAAMFVGLAALRHARRREGLALLAVLALQVVLGAGAAQAQAAPAFVLAHNAVAALGLALLASLALARPAGPGP